MQDTSAAIASLKKQLGANLCIMGHHYQNDNVVRHCDITGDSLELARRVPGIDAAHIVFCGVYFMGESAALLAKPGQSVHLPSLDADCLLSRMTPAPLARKVLEQLAATGRKIIPLAYVNTDLALKAVVGEFGGAVCTSANAKIMLRWALDQGDGVLFGRQLIQQRLDELVQVVDLLELAARVLVELAVACQNMQRFEQLN